MYAIANTNGSNPLGIGIKGVSNLSVGNKIVIMHNMQLEIA
ncbi:hypothetical protein [Bacillus cereus]